MGLSNILRPTWQSKFGQMNFDDSVKYEMTSNPHTIGAFPNLPRVIPKHEIVSSLGQIRRTIVPYKESVSIQNWLVSLKLLVVICARTRNPLFFLDFRRDWCDDEFGWLLHGGHVRKFETWLLVECISLNV